MDWHACGGLWGILFSSGRATAWSRPRGPRRSPGLFSNCWSRSEEHTSELQSLMRISYAVSCLNKKSLSHGFCDEHPLTTTSFSYTHPKDCATIQSRHNAIFST